LLQETTDEMGRNGCKKIIVVNGHGGNENLLPFFAQSQLEKQHDYVVYVLGLVENPPGGPAKKTSMDMHAGELETSTMLVSRPDLVYMDRANQQSGADLGRLQLPANLYTGIWWYARFPNHYSGDGAAATHELGEHKMNGWIDAIENSIKAVKADRTSLQLQMEFFEKAMHPLDTRQ
jgi:creatinine amidohydrolase